MTYLTKFFYDFLSITSGFMLLILGLAVPCSAQLTPGDVVMTPFQQLETERKEVIVPSQFQTSGLQNRFLDVPQGYTPKIFYRGNLLGKPRFFTWSPDSVLHVANLQSGRIIALPDKDNNGEADTAIVVASNVFAHSIEFFRGDLYAAEERQVVRLSDIDSDGIYETEQVFIDEIAEGATQPGGGHRTRTLVFDEQNEKLYLSIGSLCNVCRETFRAVIEEYNLDGAERRIYADGVRNAVGMTLHPMTNQLWATNNGSDNQGNDIPPEWIDIVRDGGFYGYPFAHSYQAYFDFNRGNDYRALRPITSQDSARVRTMRQPAALIQSHSAPMAIEFSNSSFPELYRHGAFVAYRGSWNRSPATGYKIVYLDFASPTDTIANFVADFVSGFLTDSINSQRWARPVGLETDSRGNLYLGSDAINQFIMILQPDVSTGIEESPQRSHLHGTPSLEIRSISPQPAGESVSIVIGGVSPTEEKNATLRLLTLTGEVVREVSLETLRSFSNGTTEVTLDVSNLSSGTYFCQMQTTSGSIASSMVIF